MPTRAVTLCLMFFLCLGGAVGEGPRVVAHPPCLGRAPPCAAPRPPRDARSAVVLRVVDGDTVVLLLGGRPVRVRLIGVDAPEIWHRHDCFGAEAARALRALLGPGSPVRVAGDREPVDRYGRRLLYLWVPGGPHRQAEAHPRRAARHPGPARRAPAFVAASLIRAGLARAMSIPPNTRYAAFLYAAQSAARHARVGLWAACAVR